MLSEEALEMMPERIALRLQKVNSDYLETVGKKIAEIGKLRASDVHKLQQMYYSGGDISKITAELAACGGKNISDIYDMFNIVAAENYNYAKPFFAATGKDFIPYAENEALQSYVRSLAAQTVGEYANLTQNTAFCIFDANGKIAPYYASNAGKAATSLSETYTRVIDEAVTTVQLGYDDYQAAMRKTVKALAAGGIQTVDYATGYTKRLDSAVRQNVLWGIKKCNQLSADYVGEQFGADGYEISYHAAPRPSHEAMGGGQYAIGRARRVGGKYYPSFDTVSSLLEDFGCLHFKFPILLGVSSPAHSKRELAELKALDREPVEFEGKTYSRYEATQMQRRLETEMRKQKDIANTAKAAEDDDLRREAQTRINQLAYKYKQFSDAAKLPTKVERARVAGFRRVKTQAELTNHKLHDIIIGKSVGSKAKNYDVLDFKTSRTYHFAEGTKIQNVEVFAGKNTKIIFRNAQKYADRYGGSPEDWQHVKGFGLLATEDGDRFAEIHWVQCKNIGKHDLFVKEWLDEG